MRPQPATDTFNPGRGINETYLNDTNTDANENDYDNIPVWCIVWPGDAVHQPVLVNQTEYIKTAANQSDVNKVYLSTYKGTQYSMLGPTHTPNNLDISSNELWLAHRMSRLSPCSGGAISTFEARNAPPYYFNFICNETMAGLSMTGNFESLGPPISQNDSKKLHVETSNTLTTSSITFGFQYFDDSAKRQQVQAPDLYGLSSVTRNGNTTNQFYWLWFLYWTCG